MSTIRPPRVSVWVVDLVRLDRLHRLDERGLIEKIALDELQPIREMGDPLVHDRARTTCHPDHLVAPIEQEFGETRPILSGNAGGSALSSPRVPSPGPAQLRRHRFPRARSPGGRSANRSQDGVCPGSIEGTRHRRGATDGRATGVATPQARVSAQWCRHFGERRTRSAAEPGPQTANQSGIEIGLKASHQSARRTGALGGHRD